MPTKPVRLDLGDAVDYNPITLAKMPEDELRQEYKRLRRTALGRFRRIEQSEDFGESPVVANNKAWLERAPSELDKGQLAQALSRVEGLLNSPSGSLSGLRESRSKTIASLKERGVRGITSKNFADFQRFMNKTRAFQQAYIPYPKRSKGSEARDAARQVRPRMFMLMQKGNISEAAIMREFQFFRDNLDKLEKLQRSGALNVERKRGYSANELRKMLGMEPQQSGSVAAARKTARELAGYDKGGGKPGSRKGGRKR